jgi:glutaconate CoA-transferase subunit B
VVPIPEIFRYWLQGGRVDVGFLGAAQVDKFGNINTTVIGGDYAKPKVRLPGAGGAPEIASNAKETWIIIKQTKRSFVAKLDFMTSVGHLDGGDSRAKSGARGKGPTAVITDLGVLAPDPVTRELALVALHPGVTLEQAKASTGWDLKAAAALEHTAAPTRAELDTLRDLQARTAKAHGTVSSE